MVVECGTLAITGAVVILYEEPEVACKLALIRLCGTTTLESEHIDVLEC